METSTTAETAIWKKAVTEIAPDTTSSMVSTAVCFCAIFYSLRLYLKFPHPVHTFLFISMSGDDFYDPSSPSNLIDDTDYDDQNDEDENNGAFICKNSQYIVIYFLLSMVALLTNIYFT